MSVKLLSYWKFIRIIARELEAYASISLWKEGVLLFDLLASFKYTQIHHLKENTLSFWIDWCDLLGIERN